MTDDRAWRDKEDAREEEWRRTHPVLSLRSIYEIDPPTEQRCQSFPCQIPAAKEYHFAYGDNFQTYKVRLCTVHADEEEALEICKDSIDE